jgi:lysophospholipase L1-like esterase
VIIFLATLGPSPLRFGDGLLNLPPELKAGYVKERQAYIENHIAYANKHGIPLVNVYDETRDAQGNVDLTMLRADDHLHPSQKGVDYIQDRLADHIIDSGYLPE